jgi:hypothetical protein
MKKIRQNRREEKRKEKEEESTLHASSPIRTYN